MCAYTILHIPHTIGHVPMMELCASHERTRQTVRVNRVKCTTSGGSVAARAHACDDGASVAENGEASWMALASACHHRRAWARPIRTTVTFDRTDKENSKSTARFSACDQWTPDARWSSSLASGWSGFTSIWIHFVLPLWSRRRRPARCPCSPQEEPTRTTDDGRRSSHLSRIRLAFCRRCCCCYWHLFVLVLVRLLRDVLSASEHQFEMHLESDSAAASEAG
jgi:hypothetical protein